MTLSDLERWDTRRPFFPVDLFVYTHNFDMETTKVGVVTHGEGCLYRGSAILILWAGAPAFPKIIKDLHVCTWYEKQ